MLDILIALAAFIIPTDKAELVFAGDAMQHQVQIDAARTPSGELDYSPYFTEIKPYIESADYAVVNLETPLGVAPYSGYPMFCAHDNYLSALTDAGFDLMLSANNHILDRHDKGLLRTIHTFESSHVPWLGIWRNKAHRDSILPLIRDINGFRVAFLNYTYGTNGISPTTPVVIDYIDRELMASDIRKARESGAEIVAVCVHWGDEYKLLPNAHQKSLASFLSDQGADLIIGGHPHVIQPMELERKADGKTRLTVYSLGNFISGMRTTDTRGGAMVRVTLRRDLWRRPYVSDASYRLVFTQKPQRSGENFRLMPVESEKLNPSVHAARDGFCRNARAVFGKHNINVPEDTLPITGYMVRGRKY